MRYSEALITQWTCVHYVGLVHMYIHTYAHIEKAESSPLEFCPLYSPGWKMTTQSQEAEWHTGKLCTDCVRVLGVWIS